MQRRRVLILYYSPLFGAILRSLLEGEQLEVRAVRLSRAQGTLEPDSFHPDVLVVEQRSTLSQAQISSAFHDVPMVIGLSLEDSGMRIFHERRVPSAGAGDLIAAVKGRAVSGWGHRHRELEPAVADTLREAAHG